jgi:hypothetical protein
MNAKEVWEALSAGAIWTDDLPGKLDKARLPEYQKAVWSPEQGFPLALIPFRTSETPSHNAQPPALTKIYQESGLRPAGGTVRVHPDTASAHGLENGGKALIRTISGECVLEVIVDRLVKPGVLEAPLSPSRAELAGIAKPSTPAVLEITGGHAVVAARIEKA